MRKKAISVLSVLMAVIMLIGMLPITASAADSDAADIGADIEVSESGATFKTARVVSASGLKAMLQLDDEENTWHIYVSNDIDEYITDPADHTTGINQYWCTLGKGRKILELQGHSVVIRNSYVTAKANEGNDFNVHTMNEQYLMRISGNSELIVNGSNDINDKTKGLLKYDGDILDQTDAYDVRNLFGVHNGGSLTLNSGTFECGSDKWYGDWTMQVSGSVICSSSGNITVNGGNLIARGFYRSHYSDWGVKRCAVIDSDICKATINDGIFTSKGGADIFRFGTLVNNDSLTINSARFKLVNAAGYCDGYYAGPHDHFTYVGKGKLGITPKFTMESDTKFKAYSDSNVTYPAYVVNLMENYLYDADFSDCAIEPLTEDDYPGSYTQPKPLKLYYENGYSADRLPIDLDVNDSDGLKLYIKSNSYHFPAVLGKDDYTTHVQSMSLKAAVYDEDDNLLKDNIDIPIDDIQMWTQTGNFNLRKVYTSAMPAMKPGNTYKFKLTMTELWGGQHTYSIGHSCKLTVNLSKKQIKVGAVTVKEPKPGDRYDNSFTAVTVPAGLAFSGVAVWNKEGSSVFLKDGDKFVSGTRYKASLSLCANEGYEWADDVHITVNGMVPDLVEVERTGEYCYVDCYFEPGKVDPLSVVGAWMAEPGEGDEPSYKITHTDPAYEVSIEYWYNYTDGRQMQSYQTFEHRKSYFALVKFTARDGYEINLDTAYYINGEKIDPYNNTEHTVRVWFDFDSSYYLNSVSATVTAPEHHTDPEYTATLGADVYSLNTQFDLTQPGTKNGIKWTRVSDDQVMTEADQFEYGQYYAVQLELVCSNSHRFSTDLTADDVKINGVNAALIEIIPGSDDRKLRIGAVLKCEKYHQLNNVNAYVTTPAEGNKPSAASVPSDEDYAIQTSCPDAHYTNGVRWHNDTDNKYLDDDPSMVFEAGKKYTVNVRIQVNNMRAVFPSTGLNGYVNGKKGTISKLSDQVVDVAYTFNMPGTYNKVPLENVYLNMTEPKAGRNISYDVTTFDGESDYSVYDYTRGNYYHGIQWRDMSGGSYNVPSDTYTDGNNYKLFVKLQLSDKFQNSSYSVNVYINGDLYRGRITNDSGNICILTVEFYVGNPDPDIIDYVQAYITVPANGENPDFAATVPDGMGYKVDDYNSLNDGYIHGVAWRDAETHENLSEDSVFVSGREYVGYIVLKRSSSDYAFAPSSSITAKVNSKTVNADDIIGNETEVYTTLWFRYKVGDPFIDKTQVQSVSVTVTAPAPGEHPVFSASVPPGVYGYKIDQTTSGDFVNGVSWLDEYGHSMTESDVFTESGRYTVGVIVTRASNKFELASDMTARINGSACTMGPNDGETVILTQEFTCGSGAEQYDLWLGETRVTSDNCDDIFNDGSAYFNPETGVLNLSFVDITGYSPQGAKIYAEGFDLTVYGSYYMDNIPKDNYGIYVSEGSLVMDGDYVLLGKLNGVYVLDGDFTFSAGTMVARGTDGQGIYADNITIDRSVEHLYAISDNDAAILALDTLSIYEGLDLILPENGTIAATTVMDGASPAKQVELNQVIPSGKTKIYGSVTSFIDDSEQVTLDLEIAPESGLAIAETQRFSGCFEPFTFEVSAKGKYILTVSKKDHATRVYEIEVGDDDIYLEVKIHPLGDIDGDGDVTTFDYAQAMAHAKGVRFLTGYALECAKVPGDDDEVTTFDAAAINAHAKGARLLWQYPESPV